MSWPHKSIPAFNFSSYYLLNIFLHILCWNSSELPLLLFKNLISILLNKYIIGPKMHFSYSTIYSLFGWGWNDHLRPSEQGDRQPFGALDIEFLLSNNFVCISNFSLAPLLFVPCLLFILLLEITDSVVSLTFNHIQSYF